MSIHEFQLPKDTQKSFLSLKTPKSVALLLITYQIIVFLAKSEIINSVEGYLEHNIGSISSSELASDSFPSTEIITSSSSDLNRKDSGSHLVKDDQLSIKDGLFIDQHWSKVMQFYSGFNGDKRQFWPDTFRYLLPGILRFKAYEPFSQLQRCSEPFIQSHWCKSRKWVIYQNLVTQAILVNLIS